MLAYRLKSATMALHRDGSRGDAIIVPAGAELLVPEMDHSPEAAPNRTIEVLWNNMSVTMFQVDLLERGERLRAARQ